VPSLYARYVAGEHTAVWTALGTAPTLPIARAEAEAIAAETMRRVRHNVEALVARLSAAGYPFEYPLAPTGGAAQTSCPGPSLATTQPASS
jgi:hypothetical protein